MSGRSWEGKFVTLCRDYERRLAIKGKGKLSQRERAEIEAAIWEHAPARVRKGKHPYGRFFSSRFGQTAHGYDARKRIYGSHGEETLWHEIDENKMPLATGVRLLRDARAQASESSSNGTVKPSAIVSALKEIIKEYNKGTKRVLPDGSVVRTSKTTKVKLRVPTGGKKKRKPTVKSSWAKVQKLLAEYASERLQGVDPSRAEALAVSFEADVKILMEEFQQKTNRAKTLTRKTNERSAAASRRTLRQAYAVLKMDPPRKGRPIDIARVKKQKRTLAKMYHPDTNDGSAEMREHYEAVLEAAATIEEIAQMQGGIA